jgi:hypothetical protein
LANEWTSISDIGRTYQGHVLTTETYEKVENAYLDTALSFLNEAGTNQLNVRFHPQEISPPKRFNNGASIGIAEIREVLRSLLREEYWCRLEAPDGTYIHVGHDYHMFLGGAPSASQNWISSATERGLFVVRSPSPCKPDDAES